MDDDADNGEASVAESGGLGDGGSGVGEKSNPDVDTPRYPRRASRRPPDRLQ